MALDTTPRVIVRLEVVNEDEAGESHTFRYLTLESPSYSVHIGRGSRSGSKDLYPAENNAWFDSRVMSRDHAILRAQLGTKTLTIEDVGSMHGTYLDDVKLSKFQPQVVHDGDAIVFGAEVSRGPETFPALEIDIFYSFSNDDNMPDIEIPAREGFAREQSHISRNSFSVPDYDSEEDYNSEIEFKVVPPPLRDVAIPESIISNGSSFVSEDDEIPDESWNRAYCNTFESKEIRADGKAAHNTVQETTHSTPKNKISPADVIMWSHGGRDILPDESSSSKLSTDQAPATSNQPSTPQQPSTQQAAAQSISTAQSKTVTAPVMIDLSADLIDEDSESDYGDDISADLFDEDFIEEYRRSDPPADNSSFSSQSPILTSLPSKIELAAHQSHAKEARKPILPRSPLLGSAPLEQRAPSPSDAAMPKAKQAYPSFDYGPRPKIMTAAQPRQHQSTIGSVFPTARYGTSSLRSYGFPSTQDINNVQDTYQQPYYPFEPCYSYLDPPPNMEWLMGGTPIPNKPAAAASKIIEPGRGAAPLPAPASSFVTIKTTPRVAIRDLVDEPEILQAASQEQHGKVFARSVPVPRQANLPTPSSLKRKADHISEAETPAPVSSQEDQDDVMPSLSQYQEDAQVIEKPAMPTNSQSQTDLWGTMIENASSAASKANAHDQTSEERPKKRVRSDLYKYAAGAVGGMAIGAVGVVAALVALPSDFFV